MSEITDDYYNDSDVQRWKVPAKAAQLSGSGTKTSYPWVMMTAILTKTSQ